MKDTLENKKTYPAQVRESELFIINGPVQVHDKVQDKVVTKHTEYVGQEVLVKNPDFFHGLAKVRTRGPDGLDLIVSKKNLIAPPESINHGLVDKDSLVRIIGPVSTRQYVSGYWVTPPGSQHTDNYKNKIARILEVRKDWRGNQFYTMSVKSKTGRETSMVCWPSSVEPFFTL